MSRDTIPRVSVGLPVYNGERFVGEAIQSILDQTLEDLELVISDNASTDGTEEICRSFARGDDRVVYVRRPQNIGGPRNFNFVLELARAPYFKWMAHDDVCRPDFLRVCVDALDRDPSVVLAYPSPVDIDENGDVIGPRDQGLDVTSGRAYQRFRALMVKGHAALPQFGVVRTDVLRATGGLGGYAGADRPMLGELALHGRLLEVRQPLYLHREHRQRSTYADATTHGLLAFWDPTKIGRPVFPMWRRLAGYLAAISRSPVPAPDKARCYLLMLGWIKGMRRPLSQDLAIAARQLTGLAPRARRSTT